MDVLAKLGTAMGLSFASGVNTYATVFIAGLAIRMKWVTDVPPGLEPLASDPILVISGIMYACEFVADKVPAFDSLWDAIHTFIRPVAGAGLAFAATGTAQPEFALAMTLLGGSLAATTHATKAGTRLVVNTSPEPFSNIAISTAEDVGAFSLAWLAVAHPVWAGLITVGLVTLILVYGPRLARLARFVLGAWASKIATWFGYQARPDVLPGDHLAALGGAEPRMSLYCVARNCGRSGSWRRGYLSRGTDRWVFTYRSWFRVWVEPVKVEECARVTVRPGWVADTLDLGSAGARFLVVKSRAASVQRLANLAAGATGAERAA